MKKLALKKTKNSLTLAFKLFFFTFWQNFANKKKATRSILEQTP